MVRVNLKLGYKTKNTRTDAREALLVTGEKACMNSSTAVFSPEKVNKESQKVTMLHFPWGKKSGQSKAIIGDDWISSGTIIQFAAGLSYLGGKDFSRIDVP